MSRCQSKSFYAYTAVLGFSFLARLIWHNCPMSMELSDLWVRPFDLGPRYARCQWHSGTVLTMSSEETPTRASRAPKVPKVPLSDFVRYGVIPLLTGPTGGMVPTGRVGETLCSPVGIESKDLPMPDGRFSPQWGLLFYCHCHLDLG